MPEDPNGGQDPSATPEAPDDGQDPSGGDEFDKDRALATIGKLRDIEKTQGKELRELQEKLKVFENEKLSESEKLQRRVQELEDRERHLAGELTRQKTSRVIEAAARRNGVIDPDAVPRLLDEGLLEFDDDGVPTQKSVNAALKALLEEKPYLAGTSAGPGNGDGGARRTPPRLEQDMNTILRRAAGRT